MNIFDYSKNHQPPSYESGSANAMWDFYAAYCCGPVTSLKETQAVYDPATYIVAVDDSTIMVIEDGKKRILF